MDSICVAVIESNGIPQKRNEAREARLYSKAVEPVTGVEGSLYMD